MEVDFKLPHLGENISSADIIKISVNEGDKIEVDQILMEIETDKATVEVPSEISGVVKKILVKAGQKAKVGETIMVISAASSDKQQDKPQASSSKSQDERQTTSDKQQEQTQATSYKQQETTSIPAANDKPLTTSLVEFKIPTLGENITTASITKVLVKPGDKIEVDQIVLEIETDKATVEVPTEVGGVVKEVKVKDGDKVAVGATAFTIEAQGAKTNIPVIESKQPSISAPAAVSEMPAAGKQPFQKVEHTHSPTVVTIPKDISKVVVPAAPSVRRFAREIGVDIKQVYGTGLHGRISFDDVKAYAKALNEKIQSGGIVAGGLGIAREQLPDFTKWGEVEHQPMSNIRRKTAEHLSYAWSSVPHVTQFDKADITELDNLRKQFSKKAEDVGGKLTITAILLKVIASGMKVFPQFNTSVDLEKSEVIYKKFVNIGIAVDTDRGLLVPVIRDADKKNIIQLSKELQDISKKARDKKLSLEDMQGGCFTISNLGGIGGTYFTPIINSPEVAILGVSKSAYEPVYINGKFEPRLMMPLSLSYDHRIIDGADGIRFLRWVINALENPFILSLEG